MPTEIQRRLSKALAAVDSSRAELAARESTSVNEYKVGLLKRYRIYRVEHFNPHKPVVFYVAYAPGEPVYELTADPGNYNRLGRADGVRIDSQEAATSYATVYLEVTRSMSSMEYIVGSAEEIRFRPHLSETEEQRRIAVFKKYGPVIRPPTATRLDSGYSVEAFVVHDQDLQRHAIQVDMAGEIDDHVSVVESGLALVYGL